MTVQQSVVEIVAQQLGVNAGEIQLTDKFYDDLGADSLDIVELAMRLEDKFGIELDPDTVDNCCTVQSVIEYIDQRVPAEASE